jgi:predicted adenylyl cyclase CyaB
MHVNYEFKAVCPQPDVLETRLQSRNPLFVGTDHQVDTYFNVNDGRLKLREGNIEHALIHYTRKDAAGAKQSDVLLYHPTPGPELKEILTRALGVKVVIDKQRRIYFIDNVKFHFDTVEGLGSFVEVEAIDKDGSIGIEKLRRQCSEYAALFEISDDQYLAKSYSDMLLEQ